MTLCRRIRFDSASAAAHLSERVCPPYIGEPAFMWKPDLHLVDLGLAEIANLVALLEGAGAAPTLQDMHPGETLLLRSDFK